jgi:NitT/TauT family transport system permease protein
LALTHAENPAQGHSTARNWRRNIERAGPLLLILLLVVLWQILTRALDIPNFLLPALTDIARLMVDEWPLIQMHSLATIGSIASGHVTAVLLALAIFALMIRFAALQSDRAA